MFKCNHCTSFFFLFGPYAAVSANFVPPSTKSGNRWVVAPLEPSDHSTITTTKPCFRILALSTDYPGMEDQGLNVRLAAPTSFLATYHVGLLL